MLQPGCGTRSATWALSRATNSGEKPLAMFTRVLTWTQKVLGGPVVTLVHVDAEELPDAGAEVRVVEVERLHRGSSAWPGCA